MSVSWGIVLLRLLAEDPELLLTPETLGPSKIGETEQSNVAGKGTNFAPKQITLSPVVVPVCPGLHGAYPGEQRGLRGEQEAPRLKGPRGQSP